jgi:hypothetical protein
LVRYAIWLKFRFFVDSRASRLVQLADLVAYATFRWFERDDVQFFDLIKDRFDREGGIVHGLKVIRASRKSPLSLSGDPEAPENF